MAKFEITEHTADVGVRAFGATREELFANAALGMFSIIGDLETVQPRETREVCVRADYPEGLLAAFLGELLYLFDAERFVLHDAAVKSVSDCEVCATLRGEPIALHHDLRTEIKAVTHHNLKVEKRGDAWHATVLFDI